MARISYDPSVRTYRAPGGPGRVNVDVKAAAEAALASGAVEKALFDAAGELTSVAMKGLEQRNKENFEADLKATEIKFKEWDVMAEAELKDIQITDNYELKSKQIVAKYQKLADDWIADGNVRGYGRREVKLAVDGVKNQWSSGLEAGSKAFGIAWNRETTRQKRKGNTLSHLSDPSQFNSETFTNYKADLDAEFNNGDIDEPTYQQRLLTGRTTIFNQLDAVDIAAAENAVNNDDMDTFESLRQQVIDRGNMDEEIVNNKFDGIPDQLAAAIVRQDIAAAGNDVDELEFILESLNEPFGQDHYGDLRAYNKKAVTAPLLRKIATIKTEQNSNLVKFRLAAQQGKFDMMQFIIASNQNDENGLGIEAILDDPNTLDIDESKSELEVLQEMGTKLQDLSNNKVRLDQIQESKIYKDVRAGLLNISANPRMQKTGGQQGKLDRVNKIIEAYGKLGQDAKILLMPEFLDAQSALNQAQLGLEVKDTWWPNWMTNTAGKTGRDDSYTFNQDVVDGSNFILNAWQSKYRVFDVETDTYKAVIDPMTGGPVDMSDSLEILEKASESYLKKVSELQATRRANGEEPPNLEDYRILAEQSYLELNLPRQSLERILEQQ